MPDEEEMRRVNPFDWEKEFSEIMADGGFDAVIGNPPYVRQEGLGDGKAYYESHYDTFVATADLYVNFIEKGLRLLKSTGLFGMIVSNKWLRTAYGRPLRRFLAEEASVMQIVDMAGLPVFANATVRTLILICSRHPGKSDGIEYLAPVSSDMFHTLHNPGRLQQLVAEHGVNLPTGSLSADGWSPSGEPARRLMERLEQVSVTLETYVGGKPLRGIITGLNKAFIIDPAVRDRLVAEAERNGEIIRPLLVGRDVRRYRIDFEQRYLLWTYKGVPIERYPAILRHLSQFQAQLEKRWDKGDYWWELRACTYYDRFEQPKIIYPDIATSCRFALDQDGYFASNTTYFIPRDDAYLLGILNSKLGLFCFTELCAGLEGEGPTYLRFFGQYIERFPVRPIDPDDPGDVARHDKMVALVERVLGLHKKLAAATVPADKKLYQRQIDATDEEIDALVYELYGLTEEEIGIVEGRYY
jgi:hypothetical protein